MTVTVGNTREKKRSFFFIGSPEASGRRVRRSSRANKLLRGTSGFPLRVWSSKEEKGVTANEVSTREGKDIFPLWGARQSSIGEATGSPSEARDSPRHAIRCVQGTSLGLHPLTLRS